ncbi:MAG: sugar ABC transporter substrate-binding protein [Treponema sp.]|jgi:ribose transport system substrate-binding protein|nr:sugar ABC transporter substrate-binding protein [Treponema sp.]
MKRKVFSVLILGIALVLAAAGCKNSSAGSESAQGAGGSARSSSKAPADMYFAVSLGWMENASGQRQKFAFESQFRAAGVNTFDIVDANYDPKKQSEQIEAFIAKKPDALFITPSDPVGIAEAVKKAADQGIPVFSSDGYVPGALVASTVMFDNYAGGMATMEYLAEYLVNKYPSGEIAIGRIYLPQNEGWDARTHGMEYVLSQERYSRIKVKFDWGKDELGSVTPTQTISSWLAADTNKEMKAIWCAWDGAVFEGLAVTAATRPEIVYTGSDGGEQCYNMMNQYPDQFIMTLGESVYAMPTQLVGYAFNYLGGKRIPRLVMSPGFSVTSGMIKDVIAIRDVTGTINGQSVSAWQLALDYDLPGYANALNDVLRANGKTPAWIPSI